MVFLVLFSLVCVCNSIFMLIVDIRIFIEWQIITINSMSVVITLILDWMSLIFMGFVSFISAIVLFYSGGYISGDMNINRFIYLVLGFVLSITFLIIRPNLVSILLGWDGLGLVSYVLVIYYQNEKSSNAGILTALSNRIGDVAILLAIAFISLWGGWNFYFYVHLFSRLEEIKLVSVLVVLAAITKRAQIPFSAWLPAAMAAPTPVSALVHSSTLVTAGVYLLVRFRLAFEGQGIQIVLLLLSRLTIFIAGLGANFEYDLKKIIALSTLSQLGVIIRILSLGYSNLAFFHLLSHALFKALLFMCAGAVIHNIKDYQDIRVMGGLVTQMPLTTFCINLANLALCGSPFLAGFYSKDLILECIIMFDINLFNYILIMLGTILTVLYSLRISILLRVSSRTKDTLIISSDTDKFIHLGIWFLIPFSLFGGINLIWRIFRSPSHIFIPYWIKISILIIIILSRLIYVSRVDNLTIEKIFRSIKYFIYFIHIFL